MKYALLLSFAGALAFVAGCGDDTKTGNTGGSGGSDTTSSSSSSGNGSSSSGTAGAGGMGTGGMGTGGMGTGGMGTGGSGGGAKVCDNSTVVDKEDAAARCQAGNPSMLVTEIQADPSMIWADKLGPFSSEYGPGMWGANQATQAPNVYPASGDEPNSWAQVAGKEDAAGEFITVQYTTPVVAESVWIYETFNPGAIAKVTITTADGPKEIYNNAGPKPIGQCSHILSVSTKTCSPVSAVRIDLAADKVIGINEIDAVGLLPAK
jgi:hypothetical protein